MALLVVVAGGLYLAGVRRLRRRGRAWPRVRSAPFVVGLAVIVVAVSTLDAERFSAHATQHVLLGMVAPALLALGAPVTLALQASSRPTQTALLRIVHGPVLGVLTHPVLAWVVFAVSLPVLYLTPLLDASLRNDLVHAAVHLHLLATGCLLMWPLVGLDPVRWRVPYGGRMLLVLLLVPFHAVVGLAILSTGEPLAGGTLGDQRTGAGILWAVGDLVGVLVAGLVLAQWWSHEERAAARADRALDTVTSAATGG